jgi:hypothetical protein
MRTSFFTYFTSGYGMLWFLLFAVSFLTQSHINTGPFGFYGFPIIALIYAFYRRASDADKLSEAAARIVGPKT